MNNYDNDTPKYKKKKKSSTSKSFAKAKHKHEYTERCIIKYPTPYLEPLNGKKFSFFVATYCKHCGKIGDSGLNIVDDYSDVLFSSTKRLMTNEEILEHYKDLEIYEVESFFAKFVPIKKGCDKD